jgi:hypothetical protein
VPREFSQLKYNYYIYKAEIYFLFFSGKSYLKSEEINKAYGFNCKLADATVICSVRVTQISVAG